MSDEVIVRSARIGDRERILDFHRALYLDYRDKVLGPELRDLYAYRDFDNVLRQDVDGLLGRPGCVVLVAERGGELVGYITGHVETDPRRVLTRRGIVEDWFVIEEARGGGIGRKLFDALVDEFRRSACDLVESSTWALNHNARAVHQALGFCETQVQFRMRLD